MRYGRRVVVTGLGAVTPLGVGTRRSWRNLIAGQIGVRSLAERFSDKQDQLKALPSRIAGLVPRGQKADGGWSPLEWIDDGERHRMAEFAQYAMAAAEEAIQDSGFSPFTAQDKERTGVSLGSGIGNLDDLYTTSTNYHTKGYRTVSPLFVPRLLINLAAGHISIRHGLLGPNTATTTACTTGAHSIGDAARLIAHGDADVMIAGASEACIHPLAIAGFARARSLATDWNDNPAQASQPFDRDRAGFVIGEGAGVLVLEELDHALERGAEDNIYAEVLGYGQSADGNHITAPLASGHGAALAMFRALSDAAVPSAAVDYVNAHATSTRLGDAAENKAILDVLLGRGDFGAERWQKSRADQSLNSRRHGTKQILLPPAFKQEAKDINISSTKGATGHLLGAAGAVEAIFTILALKNGILPPTVNLKNLDCEARDEHGREVWTANYVPDGAQDLSERKRTSIDDNDNDNVEGRQHIGGSKGVKVALSNSFGFGGTNASLCFGRWDGHQG